MRNLFLALVLLWLPATLWAQEGRLERAIALWLEGNDRDSLPMLAELAQSGDATARILLAQIDVKDRGHSPFRAGLSPSEARALFRRDTGYGGFSQSWLKIEAETGNALAEALLATRHPRPDPSLISRLRGLGEVEATDYPIRVVALYADTETKRRVLDSDEMMEALRPYVEHQLDPVVQHGDGLGALRQMAPFAAEMIRADDPDSAGMAGLLALGFAFGDASAQNRWRGLVEEWVLTASAMRPMADLCRESCPGEVTGCGFAMLALSGGYFEAIRLDTPLESVISQERFLSSPRARLMTLRRAALAEKNAGRGWIASYDEIAEMSQCAADLIRETRAGYE